MEGITSALSSLGSSPVLKDALSLANLGSTGYNLYNQYQQQQYQNKLRSLSTDPAAMAKLAQGYTQPLNAGLTTAVANQAQANLATRGLTDSPEISQQVYAQAIAPYVQENQQQGYNLALQALGLGGGAIPPGQQQQTGLDALAKAFSQWSDGGNGRLNPAQLAELFQQGTVQPTQWTLPTEPDYGSQPLYQSSPSFTLDTGSLYEPDYAASLS